MISMKNVVVDVIANRINKKVKYLQIKERRRKRAGVTRIFYLIKNSINQIMIVDGPQYHSNSISSK